MRVPGVLTLIARAPGLLVLLPLGCVGGSQPLTVLGGLSFLGTLSSLGTMVLLGGGRGDARRRHEKERLWMERTLNLDSIGGEVYEKGRGGGRRGVIYALSLFSWYVMRCGVI